MSQATSEASLSTANKAEEDKNRRACQRNFERKARKKLNSGFSAIDSIRRQEGGGDGRLSNADKIHWLVEKYKSKSRNLEKMEQNEKRMERLRQVAVNLLGIEQQGPDVVLDIEILFLHLHNQLIAERANNRSHTGTFNLEDFVGMFLELPDDEGSATPHIAYM